MEGIVLFVLGLGIYFVPSIVASNRMHRNRTAIFVLNLFLGWTLLGWVVALVWAFAQSGSEQAEEPGKRVIDREPYSVPVSARSEPPKVYPSFIAGLAHRNDGDHETRGARAARYLCKGQLLELVPEPDNEADATAVAVYRQGYRYGFIPVRHDWVHRALTEGKQVTAEITAIEKADDPDAHVFVKLQLQIV
jgi:hypothetical protein